jgi:hypothetical protein
VIALVAQRIEHLTTDQKVGGSSPSERAQVSGHFRKRGGRFCCQNCCQSCPEQVVHRVIGLLPKLGQDVRVGVHRDTDLAVPEHLHDGPRGNTLSQEDRCAPVPQVVQPQQVQASLGPQLIPALVTFRGSIGVPTDDALSSSRATRPGRQSLRDGFASLDPAPTRKDWAPARKNGEKQARRYSTAYFGPLARTPAPWPRQCNASEPKPGRAPGRIGAPSVTRGHPDPQVSRRGSPDWQIPKLTVQGSGSGSGRLRPDFQNAGHIVGTGGYVVKREAGCLGWGVAYAPQSIRYPPRLPGGGAIRPCAAR